MSDLILSLPLYKATVGFSTDEDFKFSLSFTLADGVTPLALTGITFALSVGVYDVPTRIGGTGNNILSAFMPAAGKANWMGVFTMSLLASDGTFTSDVFQELLSSATLDYGQTWPLQLQKIASPATALISACPFIWTSGGGGGGGGSSPSGPTIAVGPIGIITPGGLD